jgi:hypothetical protein
MRNGPPWITGCRQTQVTGEVIKLCRVYLSQERGAVVKKVFKMKTRTSVVFDHPPKNALSLFQCVNV